MAFGAGLDQNVTQAYVWLCLNWVPGDDVIVHPSIKDEQAKELFPEFRAVKPYLRFTPLPKDKATV